MGYFSYFREATKNFLEHSVLVISVIKIFETSAKSGFSLGAAPQIFTKISTKIIENRDFDPKSAPKHPKNFFRLSRVSSSHENFFVFRDPFLVDFGRIYFKALVPNVEKKRFGAFFDENHSNQDFSRFPNLKIFKHKNSIFQVISDLGSNL